MENIFRKYDADEKKQFIFKPGTAGK